MKILIFKMDEVAYNSTRVFADVLGNELIHLGAQVEFFDIKEHNSLEELENLLQSEYDAIIDFNSRLPGLVVDDSDNKNVQAENYFIDKFNAPFYNYIVDHPVYHHKNLMYPLKNYNVICIDEYHAEYIRRYYPTIKSVITEPLGAIKLNRPELKYDARNENLLFMGTYLAPSDYYQIIEELPKDLKCEIKKVIELLIENTDMTYEQAVQMVLKERVTSEKMLFPALAQMLCMADIYVRAYYRDKILEKFADTGIDITICGENYQNSLLAEKKNVNILPQVTYMQSLDYMCSYKYVLNIMPWFKAGIHDRVVNSMINGAVCISDSSELMKKNFEKNVDYLEFDLKNMDSVIEIAEAVKNNNYNFYDIAQSGRKKAESMTFRGVAQRIIKECSL